MTAEQIMEGIDKMNFTRSPRLEDIPCPSFPKDNVRIQELICLQQLAISSKTSLMLLSCYNHDTSFLERFPAEPEESVGC